MMPWIFGSGDSGIRNPLSGQNVGVSGQRPASVVGEVGLAALRAQRPVVGFTREPLRQLLDRAGGHGGQLQRGGALDEYRQRTGLLDTDAGHQLAVMRQQNRLLVAEGGAD